MNWFAEDFRKVHVLFCAPEWCENRGELFDPRAFVRALAEAGVRTIEFYVKDHHGVSYNHTAIGNNLGRDIVGPLVEEAHRHGIKFLAYYSVEWDEYIWDNRPEWRKPGAQRFNVANPVSTSSGYREYALAQIEEIAENYEIDGLWLDIVNESDEEFVREAAARVKKHRPQAVLTLNGAGERNEGYNRHCDWSSVEAHGPQYVFQGYCAKYLQREKKPFEILAPENLHSWAGWSPTPLSMLQVEAALVSAHGGSLTIGLTPNADGSVHPVYVEILAALWRDIEKREPYLIGAKPVADVAVWIPQFVDFLGIHAALTDHHIQYTVIKDPVDLQGFRVVITPDAVRLDGDQANRMREYVASGGKWIAIHETARGLEDVLGIRVTGRHPYRHSYIQATDPTLKAETIDYPILTLGTALRCRETTGERLAEIVYPLAEYTDEIFFGWGVWNPPGKASGYPAIVANRFGKGEAIFIATSLTPELENTRDINWYLQAYPSAFAAIPWIVDELKRRQLEGAPWLRQLLAALIDRLLEERSLRTNAPPGVEMIAMRQEGRTVIHLVNTHAAPAGRYAVAGNVLRPQGITVSINAERLGVPGRVYAAPGGEELAARHDDGWITVEVPPFDVHAMVVVE